MKHITRRTVASLVAAAAILTLATGCTPSKQEHLDSAQMRIDCDRLGGDFVEYQEITGVLDPQCAFDDVTGLRVEEGH